MSKASKRQASGGGVKPTAAARNGRKSAAKSASDSAVPSKDRQLEVLGLIVMMLSVLLVLGLASYSPSDDPLAADFRFSNILNKAAPSTTNILGLLGAWVAWLAIPNFLGYPIILPAFLLFIFGYALFRRRSLQPIVWRLITGSVATVVLSTFAGWLSPGHFPTDWSGTTGAAIAATMTRALGSTGSLIVLIVGALILILLTIETDVQEMLDWIEERFDSFRQKLKSRPKPEPALVPSPKPGYPDKADFFSPPADLKPSVTTTAVDGGSAVKMPRNDLFRSKKAEGPQSQAAGAGSEESPSGADIELRVRERVEVEVANLDERSAQPVPAEIPYRFPSVELLDDDSASRPPIDYDGLEENKQILLDKLETYNIEITNIDAIVGPTVTLYELTPAPGVKISRIKALEDDLAMAMAARGIRMIAPIPGKSAIGVEIPNRYRELVQVRSVMNTARFRDAKMALPVALGKTIEGEVYVEDLTKMPHLLMAGATGSGKSVGLNNLVANLLYACRPQDLKFVMIDPKRIELQQYARIFDHFIAMPEGSEEPIITDFTDASGVLNSCLREMELRYDLLSAAGVRTIKEYNKKFSEGRIEDDGDHKHLPYIVIIVDELADLMMTTGKDVEGPIARLAQMSRAVGLHLVVATQRPSVNVITGLIKANFPSRVAFQVATGVDSRTIIDQYGAEQLVGNGDMLYMSGSRIIRIQTPYISLEEIEAITNFIAEQDGPGPYILPKADDPSADGLSGEGFDDSDVDPLFADAARAIVRSQQGSVSLLQRKLSVGYARAARIVDQLEQAGVVGPFEGSKARQVLIADEVQLDTFLADRNAS
ncbi:MAG TPA: DNA translocase FtsK [Rhodothermales bacterium]|nr:DNA translocase FtsK [Rhodothermales bacterium]